MEDRQQLKMGYQPYFFPFFLYDYFVCIHLILLYGNINNDKASAQVFLIKLKFVINFRFHSSHSVWNWVFLIWLLPSGNHGIMHAFYTYYFYVWMLSMMLMLSVTRPFLRLSFFFLNRFPIFHIIIFLYYMSIIVLLCIFLLMRQSCYVECGTNKQTNKQIPVNWINYYVQKT